MIRSNTLTLLLGDLVAFVGGLFLALGLRIMALPKEEIVYQHLGVFAGIFVLWLIVFLIAGLYDVHTTISRKRIPDLVLKAQLANALIAALIFFLFASVTEITPKITLVLYITVSTILIVLWRLFLYPLLAKRRAETLLVVGSSLEAHSLASMIGEAPYFRFIKSETFDPSGYSDTHTLTRALLSVIDSKQATLIVGDLTSEGALLVAPAFYTLSVERPHAKFIDLHQLYEELFYRVPPSLIKDSWVLENVSQSSHPIYDVLKRLFDLSLALILGIVLVPVIFVIALIIKLHDGGDIFVYLKRIGHNQRVFEALKFRTMTGNDNGDYGPSGKTQLEVTKVGKVLRRLRVDELPQLWNIFKGELSFIGPRPETPALVSIYEKEIPYYSMRHMIKPGLSGWAQIYGEHGHSKVAIDETINKLSYDLYYLKQRSIWLDLEIALKTIKTLLSRAGV